MKLVQQIVELAVHFTLLCKVNCYASLSYSHYGTQTVRAVSWF
jgi:hypothetical protein